MLDFDGAASTAVAAEAFTTLIKQTAPSDGKPGKNRSAVIGQTPKQRVMLVSVRKPTNATARPKADWQFTAQISRLEIGGLSRAPRRTRQAAFHPSNRSSRAANSLDLWFMG
ncbi:MAG: hypothetical protein JO255_20570 [Alphaproteobacteria bacterium]|nr:hypothetical protein [Alphaproteobacteria bacterium]